MNTKMIPIVAVLILGTGIALAQEESASAPEETKEPIGFKLMLEGTVMGYSQEGGVQDGDGEAVDAGMKFTPRVTLGYSFGSDMTLSATYWNYGETDIADAGDPMHLHCRTMDLALTQRYPMGESGAIDLSATLRYLSYEQSQWDGTDPNNGETSAWGGGIGIKGIKNLSKGNLYAQGQFLYLVGDYTDTAGFEAQKNNSTQIELGFGYEVDFPVTDTVLLNIKAGMEWKSWSNLALGDDNLNNGVGNDDELEDIGFYGFVLGIGTSF